MAALSKDMWRRVGLARFCTNYKLDPLDVAELMTLAGRAFNAGAKGCNQPNKKAEDRTRRNVEAKAEKLGLAVSWPGLNPSFQDAKGFNVNLPY